MSNHQLPRTAAEPIIRGARRWLLLPVLVVALALPQAGAVGSDDVDLVGQVSVEHADDFVGRRSEQATFLETKSGRFKLDGPKARGLASGTTVRVHGKRSGSTVVLGDGSSVGFVAAAGGDQTPAMTTSGAAITATPTIAKRVAVLLINFVSPTPTPTPTPSPTPTPTSSTVPTPAPTTDPNGTPNPTPTPSPTPTPTPTPTPSPTPSPTPPPPTPWTLSSVRGTFFTNTRSIASYYSELANGKMAISGDVFGYFTLSMNTPTCDYATWGSAARQAATAAGINLSSYTNVVHAFTKQSACWWGGMGQLPGRNTWLNGNLSLYVVSHELGHNFGAHHASSLTCTKSGSRVAFSSNCTADEYGDPYDVMGYGGERHMHAWHRKQLGFLTATDQQTVTANGRYFVSTAEIEGGSPRILRVSRPSGKYYYLELRQPYGLFDNFATTAFAVNGVTIRIAPDTKVTQSELIDAHPETSTFNDAPLKPGETFTDPVNGISIRTTAIGPSGAQLRIQVGPDVVAPTRPTNLSTTVPSATSIKLSWTAATDDLEVTGYRITRDGVVLATISGRSYTDGLNLVQGVTYTYAVSAVDGGGNVSLPATTTRLMPDLVAPTQPGNPAAVQTDVRSVGVSWTEATDNVGVTGYAITRNGVPLATAGATAMSVADATLIDGFAYEYAIRAFDAAGNLGKAATASVYLPDVTAPSAPGTTTSTGLTATGTTARVGWLPATDNVAVVGYTVTRDGVRVATLDPAATTFEETGLPSDTTYRYGVVAFDAAGNVGPETVFSVQLKSRDLTAPTVPTNLKGTPLGSRRIQLTWSASTDDRAGTIRYRIFRGTTRIATVTSTSYVDRPAVVGWYTYKVRAVDVAGNKSAFTPTISVKARRTV